jgi:RPA family protein
MIVINLDLSPEQEREFAGRAERLLADPLLAMILERMQINGTMTALQDPDATTREMARLAVLAVDDLRGSLTATLQAHQIHTEQQTRAAARE